MLHSGVNWHLHCYCEVSQSPLGVYLHMGCIPMGFCRTCTCTHRNLYPWAQVWVFWGTGAGSPGKPQGYPCQSLHDPLKIYLLYQYDQVFMPPKCDQFQASLHLFKGLGQVWHMMKSLQGWLSQEQAISGHWLTWVRYIIWKMWCHSPNYKLVDFLNLRLVEFIKNILYTTQVWAHIFPCPKVCWSIRIQSRQYFYDFVQLFNREILPFLLTANQLFKRNCDCDKSL